jgi:hypothetical protein
MRSKNMAISALLDALGLGAAKVDTDAEPFVMATMRGDEFTISVIKV